MIFDLHVHTNYSDGLFTPEEVVDLAIEKGLDGIAITDHDTVNGIKPAIKYNNSLEKRIYIIPGIEFGCIYEDEEVHILGYFIDYKSSKIINLSNKLKKSRANRSLRMVDKINRIGLKLNIEEISTFTKKDYIGRPHIARALVKKGYVDSVEEAFKLYLNRGQPGYVEKESLSINETINIIHKLNGIAILAHPGLLKNRTIINYCINAKIDGLEAIHSKHSVDDVKHLLDIGKNNNLIITGGSDCHGQFINGEYLLGKYYINLNNIPIMKGRI